MAALEKYKQDFIEFLVKSGALKFGEFTLKSGRKCPYFLNMGQLYKGSATVAIANAYALALKDKMPEFDTVFGPAYKGIPLSVLAVANLFIIHRIEAGYSYNRKEAKDHGEGGMLVGAPISKDSKVVIVDDVMTAGTALRESIDLLNKLGPPKIVGVLIAVDRMEKGQTEKSAAQEVKDEFGITVYSIVNINEIVSYLHNKEIGGAVYIDDQKKAKIEEYRRQYGV